jgi:hypothetical protein
VKAVEEEKEEGISKKTQMRASVLTQALPEPLLILSLEQSRGKHLISIFLGL